MGTGAGVLAGACQCINLAAAELLVQVSAALSTAVHVVPQVAQEALHLHGLIGEPHTPVDLSPLALVELTEAELDTYVLLASRLDDGEAATIAVAAHRGWAVGTDDRAAVRTAQKLGVPFASIGTTEVIRRSAEFLRLEEHRIRRIIADVENRARYIPRRDDLHIDWWSSYR